MIGLTAPAADLPWMLKIALEQEENSSEGYRPLREKLFAVNKATANALKKRGVVCSRPDVTLGTVEALDLVDLLLFREPYLQRRIGSCVRQVVLLDAPEEQYDVSHSEPSWPNRIYISVPAKSSVQDLRVAEAVVHEAMHLNLTFFEQRADVFQLPNKLLYSPWREEARPASGVFHGLYVFRCVERYFSKYILPFESSLRREFLTRRVAQIRDDLSRVDVEALRSCLGRDGSALLQILLRSV